MRPQFLLVRGKDAVHGRGVRTQRPVDRLKMVFMGANSGKGGVFRKIAMVFYHGRWRNTRGTGELVKPANAQRG